MANPAAIRAEARALVALALGLVAASMTACSRPPPADIIYIHGTIYTLAGDAPRNVEDEPTATALALRGGRIVAVGSTPRCGVSPVAAPVFGTWRARPSFLGSWTRTSTSRASDVRSAR
jgi:hypothetical protein